MQESAVRELLGQVQAGATSVDEAVARLRALPFEDLGFAKVDHHRAVRCGFPEVIYCAGKTPEQVAGIFAACAARGGNVLGTRATEEMAQAVAREHAAVVYEPVSRTVVLRQQPYKPSAQTIAIVAAGTSDLPVAEEARITAEIMDQTCATFYDVGVAGIHRLLAHSQAIQAANVVVVVAGMEGALASVVGGLVSAPVIAVPTSVGYGASFHGLAALLTMLNSCATGVSVVNIDNGFAGGYIAALINRRAAGGAGETAAS
ncbi:MAG TPA: nickel pincer cofactor biosynthesis protein LarB [Phycisphaerae bacterium]|nr:nickel pincer cofactor biosynthesis protein LarB [Phycisphaerae bacterium]